MPNPEVQAPTVLVVDDEETERTLMAHIIERQGFSVVFAGTCAEARAVFRRMRDQVALVLVDISLPDGNGLELTISLRKQKSDLRVLLVSGHVGAEMRRFYGPEVQDFQFLSKPFTSAQLGTEVRSALKQFPANRGRVSDASSGSGA